MSRLIMWNLISVDGAFEGEKPWDLGWHELAFNDEVERLAIEQLRGADSLLLGRRTFDGFADYWSKAKGEVAELMNAIPKFVFTRKGEVARWSNTTVIREDAAEAVARLKRLGERESFVFGSAELCATLVDHDLFDEYRLLVTPVILGSGRTLFAKRSTQRPLRLIDTRTFASGGVVLRYEPIR